MSSALRLSALLLLVAQASLPAVPVSAAPQPAGTEAGATPTPATVHSLPSTASAPPVRIMENLGRGVVAVHQPDGKVFVSWRLLGLDPEAVAFNLYRTTAADTSAATDAGPFGSRPDPIAGTIKLNPEPIADVTWFLDTTASLQRETSYFVRSVVADTEGEPSRPFTVAVAPQPYVSIPLQTPEGYTPGDASAGDLDGDGEYEIVLKQEQRPQDNSRSGVTGDTLLQAYKLDGRHLWTIHLGKNIREGAHYTQFMVYDLDSDGRAEIACKTADGTTDGIGKVIGDPAADWRGFGEATAAAQNQVGPTPAATPAATPARRAGHILRGPEYLTIFDGRTGAALATTDYLPARHPDTQNPTAEQLKSVWGDGNGNRSDRYLASVAYLDGEHPSLVMCRGYYTRAVLAAWDWRGGRLSSRWVFDSDSSEANRAYRGQGNHNLSVADVDGDGRDEIVYGAAVIDDNGTGLYSTGWGHGDALHVGDLVPENPGLEIFDIQERFDQQGMSLRDARTGRPLFTIPSVKADEAGGDKGEGPGRGNAFNIDPRFPGAECWAAGSGMDGLYSAKGERILERRPHGFPTNFGILWDGDLLHELLDQNRIVKWNWQTSTLDPLLMAHGCISNNSTKATPALSVDLWGDWREEVIWRTRDNRELRIYTSTIPTKHRLVTLLHDPVYRLAIAWQNVAYNQPPHPSFYLDEAAPLPPRPSIRVPGP